MTLTSSFLDFVCVCQLDGILHFEDDFNCIELSFSDETLFSSHSSVKALRRPEVKVAVGDNKVSKDCGATTDDEEEADGMWPLGYQASSYNVALLKIYSSH